MREFLSDPHVITLPRWIWLPILYGVLLLYRPFISAKKYKRIWTKYGSPLLLYTQAQAIALQNELSARNINNVKVVYAMRYGVPSIASTIAKLIHNGCTQQLIVLPLYPQYALSSTATALKAVYRSLLRWRQGPMIHTIAPFYNNADYIAALAKKVQRYWQQHGQAEHLVMSFHGVPVAMIKSGDPYFTHCMETARHLSYALELNENQYTLAFQSRFGKGAWLQPATDQVLKKLALSGIKYIDIICPGFVADCLETLEEIEIEGKAQFERYGGVHYRYIPCLNNDENWVSTLANLCHEYLIK